MTTSLGNEVNGNRNAPLYFPFHSADGAAGAQAVNRSSVAALAFLVWDILITVDDEVNLIWPRAWNYTKYVYFLVRYLPMLVQVSILLIGSELTPHFHFTAHDCYIWQIYQGVAASSIVAMVDTVLILRSTYRSLHFFHCKFSPSFDSLCSLSRPKAPCYSTNCYNIIYPRIARFGCWFGTGYSRHNIR